MLKYDSQDAFAGLTKTRNFEFTPSHRTTTLHQRREKRRKERKALFLWRKEGISMNEFLVHLSTCFLPNWVRSLRTTDCGTLVEVQYLLFELQPGGVVSFSIARAASLLLSKKIRLIRGHICFFRDDSTVIRKNQGHSSKCCNPGKQR